MTGQHPSNIYADGGSGRPSGTSPDIRGASSFLGGFLRYFLAVAAVGAGLSIRLAIETWVGPGLPTYITFYPLVMVCALLAGFGPGLLATLLTMLVAGVWILPPRGLLTISAPVDMAGFILFGVMGAFISTVASLYRRDRPKAAAFDRDRELREATKEKEFLADLLENASEPFSVGYPDGRLGRFNRAFERLTGYTARELAAVNWSETLTPPEWRGSEKEKLDELRRGGNPVRYLKEYLRKDGTRVPVELLVNFARGAEGEPEYYYAFITDLTERNRSRDEMRALSLQRQLALDAAKMGWWHYDPVTRVSKWDSGYKEIFGVSGYESPNDEILKRIHPDDVAGVWAKVEAALDPADPKRYSAEYRIVLPDGSVKWIEAYGIALFEGSGAAKRAVSFVGTVADITARKKAGDDLRAANAALTESRRAALNLMEDALAAKERLDKTVARLDLLSRTASELLQTDDPLGLVESLCKRVMEHLGCQVFFNYLVDGQSAGLRLNAFAGISADEAGKIEVLAFGAAVCGCAARDACRIVAEHIPSTPDPRTELVKSLGVKAYAAHPIFGEAGAVLGTLSFGTRDRETFSEDDLSLMKAVTDQVGIAMIRLRADEKLRMSEERFKAVASHTPDHILMQDRELRYTLVINPQLGLRQEDMLGKTDYDVLSRADADKLTSLKRKVMETGLAESVETSLTSANGGVEHFEGTYVPRYGAGGRPVGIIGYFRNVTLRKQTEEYERQNEARLASLLKISQYQAASIQDLLDFALAEAIILTESKIGYIYRYDEETREFTLNSWSREVMAECSVSEKQTVYGLDKTGLWGEAVRQARPIVVNDFHAPNPLKKGYPEGHAALHKFLTIPVVVEERIVAVVGVANKASDYGDADVLQLTLLMDAVWKIVDKKRIEEELVRSRDEWVGTFNTIPDLITILDDQHRIVRVNKAMADKVGATERELIGEHCFLCIHGTTSPLGSCPHTLLLSDGKEHVSEVREERLGGDFLVSVTPIFDAAGRMKGSVHVARDITERKKKEQELERLNRMLKALGRSGKAMLQGKNEPEYLREVCRIVVEDCGYPMVWIGFAADGDDKSVTPTAFAGFEEGYLEGLKITWADSERGRGPTGTAIRTGKISRCRNMLTDPAFAPWRQEAIKRGYASSIALPLFSTVQERPFGAITIYAKEPGGFTGAEEELLAELANDLSHGITTLRIRAELERATETLRKERNFSRAVIQTTGGLIVGFDLEGRIQIFNHACEKVTGYTFDEVRGRQFWDFLLVDEEKEQVRDVFKAIAEGTVTAEAEYENYWVAKDGERRFIRWANSALPDESGSISLILGTGVDITERETIEEQLHLKAAELTRANQELEAFAYSVSHDLRNPLHSMMGCMDAIRDYVPKLDKDFGTAVGYVENSIQRMSDIISDLLVLSRIGRQEVHREPVDVGMLMQSFFNELKREHPDRTVRLDGAQSLTIQADAGLTRLLVENLVRNAWKFTSRRDDAVIEFGEERKNGGRILYIRDNGAGFDMANARKIFEPFVRVHSDKEFKGTGIGLAIVKRIVDKHHGTVWAEGELDKGAAFYFSLG